MSDNWLILIPVDPEYKPSEAACAEALQYFKGLVPNADEVYVDQSTDVRFIGNGANLEEISCPRCGHDLGAWWSDAVCAAFEQGFRSLIATMPCCGVPVSLNDLRYDWPVGFGRYSFEARNPGLSDLEPKDIEALRRCIGCELRIIWRHL